MKETLGDTGFQKRANCRHEGLSQHERSSEDRLQGRAEK